MAESKAPGLALAAIRGDETMLLHGYGMRDIDVPVPVDTDTQLLLCSIIQSFTAAGPGLLVDQRMLDWSRPVREVLPAFRLHDAVATERATARDLLNHTIGLPRHDGVHRPGDLSRVQMPAALRSGRSTAVGAGAGGGAPGCRSEFRCTEPDVIDAIALRQSNGVLIAAQQGEG